MSYRILNCDVLDGLRQLPSESVQCCVTSPPYLGLRDYGVSGQIGLEESPEAYVSKLVEVFREVGRVLRNDGVLWLNLGDSYAGGAGGRGDAGRNFHVNNDGGCASTKHNGQRIQRKPSSGLKPKDLIGIPWRVAFALQADAWILRQDLIWAKPNPMPESVTDRCTKAHEYVFLLSKSANYFYDAAAIKEPAKDWGLRNTEKWKKNDQRTGLRPHSGFQDSNFLSKGKNKRSVWTVTPTPYKGAHFATMPEKLVDPCVLAGSREGDTVIDPFAGSGTVGVVALRHNRQFIGIELNPAYVKLAEQRIESSMPPLLRHHVA
jgi:DNA modification methylase